MSSMSTSAHCDRVPPQSKITASIWKGCPMQHEQWPRGRSRHGGVDRIPLPDPVAGALWLAGKRYVAPDPEAALESIGADRVVCLCEPFEFDGHWPHYAEFLQTDSRALWRPTPDLGVLPAEAMRRLVAEVA